MKALVLYMFLGIGFCYAQFFEREQEQENLVFYEEISSPNEIDFFQDSYREYDQPEYGRDSTGQPGDPVPITTLLNLLLVSALGIGLFFQKRLK